ncbi:MAG: hypothetical protein U1E45_10960 [Geminicoccaceae bacterium]
MRRPPQPLEPAAVMRRFLAFTWRLALGLAPLTAARLCRLGTRTRLAYLATPGLDQFVLMLRARFEASEPRRHLLVLAQRILDQSARQAPDVVTTFLDLCRSRGQDAATLMAEGVLRAAARPFEPTRARNGLAVTRWPRTATPPDPERATFARLLAAFRLRLAERYARHMIGCFHAEIAEGMDDCPPEDRPYFTFAAATVDSS